MASWQDGPEYAPLEWPDAFTDPQLPPLDVAAPPPDRGLDAPPEPPAFAPPPQPAADLAGFVPPTGPSRDPHEPFAVVTSTLTSFATRDASWKPTDPLGPEVAPARIEMPRTSFVTPLAQINPPSFPAPGTPQWFVPPGVPQAPAPARVSMRDIVRGVTPPVLILCLLGGLINPLSLLLLVLGLVTTARIGYRRRAVAATVGTASGVLVLAALFELLTGAGLGDLYDALSGLAQFTCWGVLLALIIIVFYALSHGERPQHPL